MAKKNSGRTLERATTLRSSPRYQISHQFLDISVYKHHGTILQDLCATFDEGKTRLQNATFEEELTVCKRMVTEPGMNEFKTMCKLFLAMGSPKG